MINKRIRWRLYDMIDRADTFCLGHTWVPTRARVTVGKWWTWTFRDKTWTAVGPPPYGQSPFEQMIEVPCKWVDGKPVDWLRFGRTHPETPECQDGCVVHHRTGHHMMFWPLHWRGDRGIFERICPSHGIGHPDPDQGPYWKRTDQDWQWVHGCCGCCRNPQPPFKDDDGDPQ